MKRLILVMGYWLLVAGAALAQGPLTPPGPPAPTFKTLEQIEPRTPITNLPYTISAPGSYYVVTNLTGSAGQNGISITAGDVTLDLMGFELVGVPGSGFGIGAAGSVQNLTVRNGTVRGWGDGGVKVFFGDHIHVERIRAIQNTGIGLGVGSGSLMDCLARSNSTHGVVNSGIGLVRGCVAQDNGGDGISSVGPIRECDAQSNTARFNPGSGSIGSSNYVGTADNDVGPIGSATTATSPWANISY